MLKPTTIRMHNGCARCGGANLSASASQAGVEITCLMCGHIEVLGNSRVQHLLGRAPTTRRKQSLRSQIRGDFARVNQMRKWG